MDTYAQLLLIGGILIGAGLMFALFSLVFLFWLGIESYDETTNKK